MHCSVPVTNSWSPSSRAPRQPLQRRGARRGRRGLVAEGVGLALDHDREVQRETDGGGEEADQAAMNEGENIVTAEVGLETDTGGPGLDLGHLAVSTRADKTVDQVSL